MDCPIGLARAGDQRGARGTKGDTHATARATDTLPLVVAGRTPWGPGDAAVVRGQATRGQASTPAKGKAGATGWAADARQTKHIIIGSRGLIAPGHAAVVCAENHAIVAIGLADCGANSDTVADAWAADTREVSRGCQRQGAARWHRRLWSRGWCWLCRLRRTYYYWRS